MPNICDFSMRVKGKRCNTETLLKWMNTDYNYDDPDMKCYTVDEKSGEKVPCNYHLGFRVFEAYEVENNLEPCDDGDEIISIAGNCAWSVYSCMFNSNEMGTYMGDRILSGQSVEYAKSITDASEELELEIEIFSAEPGNAFSEHYFIDNGDVMLNDESEFMEYMLEYYDKNSEWFDQDMYDEMDEETLVKIEHAIDEGYEDLILCDWYNHISGDWSWEYLNEN